MPENQAHGKAWENHLAANVYKSTQAVSHTAAIDVPHAFNGLDPGIDVSIKVSGGDAVDMGDILRIFDEVSRDQPIHMTVLCWKQDTPTTKKLTSITEVDLTNSVQLLFGTATRLQIQALVDYVKAIPHHGRTAEHQSTYKRMAYELKTSCGGCISYAPKVDSTKQRRVQGHFGNFSAFVDAHRSTRLVAESKTGEFRGGKIPEEIESTSRIRNKKANPEVEHWKKVQEQNPSLILTKKGLPHKTSKGNKEIVKANPFKQ